MYKGIFQSHVTLAVEWPLNVLWCKTIGLLTLLRLPRNRGGRAVLATLGRKDISADKLKDLLQVKPKCTATKHLRDA